MNDHSIDHADSATSALPRQLARGLAVTAMLLAIAGGAHAESGSRLCGVQVQRDLHPRVGVGFITKVNKGDSSRCNAAINWAHEGFSRVGGTGNIQGLNRLWRRVRGGSVGPFTASQKIFSRSYNQEVCEDFTWHVSNVDGDYCVGMPRNQLMVFASSYREFARRNQ